MRTNPTTILTSDDWGVGIRYVGWDGKERTRVIATNGHVETEAEARRLALNSLRKRGQLPPTIKNVVAHRFSELGIGMVDEYGYPVKRGVEFIRKAKV
jgi:hypothetical protein